MDFKSTKISIEPVSLKINMSEVSVQPDSIATISHIHNEYEIYVNVSGNVSFMVRNKIYKIQSGDVIITRPHEPHHCIYHNTDIHKHFCMMFSTDSTEGILTDFINEKTDHDNLISLPQTQKEKLISLCTDMVDGQNQLKKYISFFSMIDLLTEENHAVNSRNLPEDVQLCTAYINDNLTSELIVKDLAAMAHVTVSTLERHFKNYTGISPYAYIQSCRLATAASILESGGSVTQAAEDSGFADYSHFIALFKKRYGKTPLKFKKECI